MAVGRALFAQGCVLHENITLIALRAEVLVTTGGAAVGTQEAGLEVVVEVEIGGTCG